MRLLPVVAFLLTFGSAACARADAMDTITFSFASRSFPTFPGLPPNVIEGVDFTVTLPAMPVPVAPPFGPSTAPGFWYNTDGLPFSEQPQGAPGTSFEFYPGGVRFLPTQDVNYPRAYDAFSLTGASSLYAGPDSAPTLLPGSYDANYYVTIFGTYNLPGTITIAPVSSGTSPVPEPGSFGLLLSGILAAAGLVRSRQQAA